MKTAAGVRDVARSVLHVRITDGDTRRVLKRPKGWSRQNDDQEEAMIPGYASETLAAAVRYMACSNEPLQKRLERAYGEFHSLIPADFSEELGEKYLAILSQLTRKGSVAATTTAMTDEEAFGIAASIVDLFFAVVGAKKTGPVYSTTVLL